MHKWNLLRKSAPVILSAAVMTSSLPVNVLAEDLFSSGEAFEVVTEENSIAEEVATEEIVTEAAEFPEENVVAEEVFSAAEEEVFSEGEAEFASSTEEADAKAAQNAEYVLMNIPYADFYKADVNNNVQVDAFTSATLNKTRTGTLAGGSYHKDSSGTEITGVTFPVKVTEGVDLSKYTQVTDSNSVDITVTNKGTTTTTTYRGKEALFESANYSYYILNETPAYYKEVSVDSNGNLSFGSVVGTTTTISGNASLSTFSNYGDYQLDISGVENYIQASDPIYGVIVSTKEGAEYGLRHMENIWRGTALAWCTGYTTEVHGCPVSSAHYESMMGKTIDKVTYYTADGIVDIDFADLYVPIKTSASASVSDASVSAGKTTITTTGLPSDYAPGYQVEGLEIAVSGNELTYQNATKGEYTLVIYDKNGKYADLKTNFMIYAEAMPAKYDMAGKAVVPADGISAEDFADYIENISSVSVNGTAYAPFGKHSVVLVNEDGTLNTEAAPIAEAGRYEIVVTSTGYQRLKFTYSTMAPGITLEKDTITFAGAGKTETIKAYFDNISTENISYKSSNTKVATVDANGTVKAVKPGKAVITVSCDGYEASCNVTVCGITLNKTKATIYTAGSKTVKITATKTGTSKAVTYKSSNTKVATVSKTGVVTAKKAGKATITVTCGNYKKTCAITVKKPTVSLTKASASIKVGKTTTIKVKATPSGKVTYTSSNKKIATVTSKGVVKGIKKGTTNIKVTCNGVTKTFKVTVK